MKRRLYHIDPVRFAAPSFDKPRIRFDPHTQKWVAVTDGIADCVAAFEMNRLLRQESANGP